MTEEEAMFILMLSKSHVSYDKLIVALDIAIKALENQKTLQEELEDIKADLENLSKNKWNKQVGADKGLELAIDVVEDRISKLKGE